MQQLISNNDLCWPQSLACLLIAGRVSAREAVRDRFWFDCRILFAGRPALHSASRSG